MKRAPRRRVLKVRVTLKHIHGHLLDLHEAVMQVLETQNTHSRQLEAIVVSQTQHAQDLKDVTAQNEKARAENVKRLKALQDALDNQGNTTPEVDEAMASLKASIQGEDDENPDDENPGDVTP